jgi:hypothetical protein
MPIESHHVHTKMGACLLRTASTIAKRLLSRVRSLRLEVGLVRWSGRGGTVGRANFVVPNMGTSRRYLSPCSTKSGLG